MSAHWIFFSFFGLLLVNSIESAVIQPALDYTNGPYAYLAINALGFTETSDDDVVRRRLELDWFGLENGGRGVTVELLEGENPAEANVISSLDAEQYQDGFFVTDIQLPALESQEIGYGKCKHEMKQDRDIIFRSSLKLIYISSNNQVRLRVRLSLLDSTRGL